ncbi:MAG: DUF2239 family protein [Caulobacteraceae bacterium]|nr:DUF2239 family protein [Caulobacteraceae bacterium]
MSGPPTAPTRPAERTLSLSAADWAWLDARPQGAEAALRGLVAEARLADERADEQARIDEAAAAYVAAMAEDGAAPAPLPPTLNSPTADLARAWPGAAGPSGRR